MPVTYLQTLGKVCQLSHRCSFSSPGSLSWPVPWPPVIWYSFLILCSSRLWHFSRAVASYSAECFSLWVCLVFFMIRLWVCMLGKNTTEETLCPGHPSRQAGSCCLCSGGQRWRSMGWLQARPLCPALTLTCYVKRRLEKTERLLSVISCHQFQPHKGSSSH